MGAALDVGVHDDVQAVPERTGFHPVAAEARSDRQRLTLPGREGFYRPTHAGHPIQLSVRVSSHEEAQMNVCYRVELSQAERSELTALLAGGNRI